MQSQMVTEAVIERARDGGDERTRLKQGFLLNENPFLSSHFA